LFFVSSYLFLPWPYDIIIEIFMILHRCFCIAVSVTDDCMVNDSYRPIAMLH